MKIFTHDDGVGGSDEFYVVGWNIVYESFVLRRRPKLKENAWTFISKAGAP